MFTLLRQWRFENASCPDLCKITAKKTWQKVRRKWSRYHSDTKNGSKNEPHFEGPKNMDMLRFPAKNNVLVPLFSAHWNCAEFREFLKLQCYKNMRICTFFCCSHVFLSHATTRAENSPPGCLCMSKISKDSVPRIKNKQTDYFRRVLEQFSLTMSEASHAF